MFCSIYPKIGGLIWDELFSLLLKNPCSHTHIDTCNQFTDTCNKHDTYNRHIQSIPIIVMTHATNIHSLTTSFIYFSYIYYYICLYLLQSLLIFYIR